MSLQESTAALLIAHGSRRDEANDDLRQLAEAVRARGVYGFVEIAYLELASPTIPEGGRRCVEHGARRVLMLPYFLSAGRHVSGDLERFRSELAAEFPHVEFRLCAPLGLHPKLVEVVLERLSEG
ncbi:MAG: CbiX/SirB N-terminal domain-containing protein [Planctomycetaceae bacterium]